MPLTRRHFLKGCAGVGAALVACDKPPARSITGSIVGGPHKAGHSLRKGPPPKPTQFEPTELLIVGGGVAGLSAGWRLKRMGFDSYTLLELGETVGGHALSGDGPLCPHPWGAHYVPAPPPEATLARLLFTELGIITGEDQQGRPIFDETYTCYAPEERIFYKGQWYPGLYLSAGASADDRRQWAKFESLVNDLRYKRGSDGLRAFAIPIDHSSRDPALLKLDTISFSSWLDSHGLTSSRLRWMTDYACRDDYCARPEQVSAWVGLHYYASRILAANPTIDRSPPTLTWPAGNGWLVDKLAENQSNQIKTGRVVFDLTPTSKGVEVSALNMATGQTEGYLAGQVVCCAPLFVAKRISAPLRASRDSSEKPIRYGPWMVANLWVDERPTGRGARPAWDNVLYDSPGLGYVAATHQRADYRGPAVLTYYLPLTDDDDVKARERLLATSWNDWLEHVLAEFKPAHPTLRQNLKHMDVMLWGHGMVRPGPGWLWNDRLKWGASTGPIHYAHSDYALPLFEEAQHQGVRAAERALRGLGHDVETLAPLDKS